MPTCIQVELPALNEREFKAKLSYNVRPCFPGKQTKSRNKPKLDQLGIEPIYILLSFKPLHCIANSVDLLLNLTLDNLVEFWIGSNFPEMYFFKKALSR